MGPSFTLPGLAHRSLVSTWMLLVALTATRMSTQGYGCWMLLSLSSCHLVMFEGSSVLSIWCLEVPFLLNLWFRGLMHAGCFVELILARIENP